VKQKSESDTGILLSFDQSNRKTFQIGVSGGLKFAGGHTISVGGPHRAYWKRRIALAVGWAPTYCAVLSHLVRVGVTLRRHALRRPTCVQTAACRCHGAGCQAIMRSNTQALVKGRIARFLDSLLSKTGVTIAVDRIAATLRSLKLVIVESVRFVDPGHIVRGPIDGKTRIRFMKFPSTRNREVAFRLPLSLYTDCRRCHSGRRHAPLRVIVPWAFVNWRMPARTRIYYCPKKYTFLDGN
jgi:hypothetical protein